jgi:hypothetical protein
MLMAVIMELCMELGEEGKEKGMTEHQQYQTHCICVYRGHKDVLIVGGRRERERESNKGG